jgi:antitoxin component YwqK of YwqJK toxin-antitoxin module
MVNGAYDGKVTFWHPNGQIKEISVHKNGELRSTKKWDMAGNIIKP